MDSRIKQAERTESKEELKEQLKDLLNKKKLLIQEGEKLFVNIKNMHKQYLPHNCVEADKINYEKFFKLYWQYRKGNAKKTPEKYIELTYGKQDFTQGWIGLGGGATIPVKVNPWNLGRPSVEFSARQSTEKTNMPLSNIEAGVGYNKERTNIFGRIEKGGVFGSLNRNVEDGKKSVNIGITDSIFALTAEGWKKIKYFFSPTAGPWISRINLATGKLSGAFSPIILVFEGIQRIISRVTEKNLVLKANVSAKRIKNGSKITGIDPNGKEITLSVSDLKRKKEKIEFKYKGKKYVGKQEGGKLYIYEKQGFWRALNPVQIGKDLVDIILVEPWKKLKDFAYGFRSIPKNKKLSKDEKNKYNVMLIDAIKRQNLNIARYVAKLLAQNSTGEEKAQYLHMLDIIEWKMAHSGFFLGYVRGLGFGNKRKMLEREIEKRIKENLNLLLENGSNAKKLAAFAYLSSKIEFGETRLGKRVPIYPLPENLSDQVITAVAKAKDKINRIGVEVITQQVKVEFPSLINYFNLNKQEVEEFKRVALLMQKIYEKVPNLKENLKTHYITLSTDHETRYLTFKAFINNLKKNNKELPSLNDIEKLDSKKLEEIYNAEMNITNSKPQS